MAEAKIQPHVDPLQPGGAFGGARKTLHAPVGYVNP
jgi:hypothetical protein